MLRTMLLLILASPMVMASDITIDLRLIETTDQHGHYLDFDYFANKPIDRQGLARASSLIKQARKEQPNNFLIDNGDLLQGSPFTDWAATQTYSPSKPIHPAYKAMNYLQYDVGNLGNHDFNYGLDYQAAVLKGAKFPYINANVFNLDSNGKNIGARYNPYTIIERELTDNKGFKHKIKVGFIGVVPPQIMEWDDIRLKGKITVEDGVEAVKNTIPLVQAKGADVIVVIPHSGLSAEPEHPMMENFVYPLSKLKGIDAILFGHAHAVYPSKQFANIKGADIKNGRIHGVPSVMPGKFADHIGIVDLTLTSNEGKWQVINGTAHARAVKTSSGAAPRDPHIWALLDDAHHATQAYMEQPIGTSNTTMTSYLALVQDDPSVQIVNQAQTAYVKQLQKEMPELQGLAVLSAAAPFRYGERHQDPTSFTYVPKGQLTLRSAADLYLYPNQLSIVKVTGHEVKEWLECSAGMFNQINPVDTPQSLIDWTFRTYNFDVIDGVDYQIDVGQPARYDEECKLKNPGSERIKKLSFNGQPIDLKQTFLVATNNYRANGGGNFAGTGDGYLIYSGPDQNRTVLINYIKQQTASNSLRVIADKNWKLVWPAKATALSFESSPSKQAIEYIQANSTLSSTLIDTNSAGFGVYNMKQ